MKFNGLRASALALATVLLSVGGAHAQGLAGPYLAATQADLRNDYDTASDFYAQLLLRDPGNGVLLQSALVSNVASGRFDASRALAKQLLGVESENQIGALVELAEAMRAEDYDRANEILANEDYRLNPLFSGLMLGWAAVGRGDYEAATVAFDALNQNETLEAYGQLHKALALALAGDFTTAADILTGDENGPLHLDRMAVLAHITSLSQAEKNDEAVAVVDALLGDGFSDTQLSTMRDQLADNQTLPFVVVKDAGDGAAMVYQIIANALTRDDSDRYGLVYARLATMISPEFDEASILTADILDAQEQHEQAIEVLTGISTDSNWYISAEVGRAEALEAAGKVEQAGEVLSKLAREKPDNLSIMTALGDVLRRDEDYAPAAEAYTKALGLIADENASHWVLYYSRGIVLERLGRWEASEADFRHALKLQPDQPHVLNYLGYSMVELSQNLEEAQSMIEKAVAARPQDGYITDSLGWVLYRVGKFSEAVPYMERAVELVPVDPIINDHLGDVLWKVGRRLEAQFQWRRALSFDPEEKDADRIRRKLEVGLDKVLEDEVVTKKAETDTAQDDG